MRKMALCAMLLTLNCLVQGQAQYKVLWSFGGAPNDGANPVSALISDHKGNLFGTTWFGGDICGGGGCGTVFELSPNSDGTWTETILYNFCSEIVNFQCADGANPRAGLVMDAAGNLYGTTFGGGSAPCTAFSGNCGVVFELSPPQSGTTWTETTLYTFCSNEVNSRCLDGNQPLSQLVFDASGSLYGTTTSGGSGHREGGGDAGVVFQLSPGPSGWTETVLYNFCSLGQGNFCPDGAWPQAGVAFDKAGNLYGTTELGGAANSEGGGTVYKLSPGANGKWAETVLLSSRPPYGNGASPMGTVSLDPQGNLFSTFSLFGPGGAGGVFRVGVGGRTMELPFNGLNGGDPVAGVLIDAGHSVLFGTSAGGGAHSFGTVFEIQSPAQSSVLYSFCSQPNCTDGFDPVANLIEDRSGNLFGTTRYGGANNQGVVFEIVQQFPKQPTSKRQPVWHTILPSKK